MIYPFSKELQKTAGDFSAGNFGLWFNKLVPLDDRNDFKACTPRSGEKNVAAFYSETYDRLKKNRDLKKILKKRHAEQQGFCRMHAENGAVVIEMRAELQSPMITGIGKTHPNEVGMTFDHTTGIPYLPATGVKGLVRLAHILNLIDDKGKADALIRGDELDDTHPVSLIPDIFGGDLKKGEESVKLSGKVVFLDAYPEKIPDLHVDIMNPHYGDYYMDDTGKIPPADYLNPVPVQFLTVQKGSVFIFRAVIQGNNALREPVMSAFTRALTDQGIGAKTAIGYGRFRIQNSETEKADSHKGNSGTETKIISERKIWEGVTLTYNPGNKVITATCKMGKATVIGETLVPEIHHKKLFKKRESVGPIKITVEAMGNAWRIIEIN